MNEYIVRNEENKHINTIQTHKTLEVGDTFIENNIQYTVLEVIE